MTVDVIVQKELAFALDLRLAGVILSGAQVETIRVYLQDWINKLRFNGTPGIAQLRLEVQTITTRDELEAWIAEAAAVHDSPFSAN